MTHIPSDFDSSDRAWVDVDLSAVVSNARRVAEVSGARLLPMVKANGYGLGAVAISRALEPLGPWGFGVATVAEGAELRSAGISRPVVVFTPLLPAWIPAMREQDLRPVIGDPAALAQWLAGGAAPFHIGVDTGMARAGVAHDDRKAIGAMREMLASAPGYEGICTHFHSADSEPASITLQRERFEGVIGALGRRPALIHAANSAAALESVTPPGELVRPGIYLYGGAAGRHTPIPVAALRCRVVAVRELAGGTGVSYGATWRSTAPTAIATLGVGYADGVPRSLGNRGNVELAGARAPIRGRVTMDMTLVEVDRARVAVGDTATVYGGLVTLDEQADAAGTISYELLTSIGPRVRRCYAAAS